MSDETQVDDFAAQVFNEGSVEAEAPEGALDSWDDIPSEGDSNENVQSSSEVSDEASSEDSAQESDKDASFTEEANGEDSQEESEEDAELESDDSEEDSRGEQAEFSEEVQKVLEEKGLVVSEDGQLGRMIKIDGEEQFVPIEELGNDFSGQKAIQKRFTELDKENRAFKQEVDTVNGYINDFRQKMQEGGPAEGMRYLSELSGVPAYQFERQLMQQLAPKIQELSQMTPEQIQARYTQEENEYLKQSLESEQTKQSTQQAEQELQAEISSIRETHGIADEEWNEAIEYVQEHEQAIRQELGENVPITAEFVADLVLDQRAYQRTESAFKAAGVNLDESNQELSQQLHDISYRNPDFTEEDLVELIQESKKAAVESKVSKGIAKRKEKNSSTTSSTKKTNNNNTTPEEDALLSELFG